MTSTERPDENTADSADRPRGRRSPFAVAAVAAAVLIAGGGGAYFATSAFGSSGGGSGGSGDSKGGAGDGNPPLLALDAPAAESGATGPGAGSGDSPPPGIAPGEPDPSGVVYRATGELPAGPDTARVYRTSGTVAAADVARLAKAFGMTGAPRSDGTSWKVGTDKDGAGPLLRVAKQAPGAWTFAEFGAAPGGDNCLKGKSCPSGGGASGGGSFAPGSEDGAIGEAAAKKAAAPVLKALRQDDADIDASRLMGAVRVVNADPVVGGLPTYGWSTAVQVDPDGRVTGGYGQLTTPERGDAYPVISAAEALKELNKAADGAGSGAGSGSGSGAGRIGGCATPVPLDEGRSGADGRAATGADVPPALPCAPKSGAATQKSQRTPESVEITEAVFGLAVRSVDGRGALVPSWLFEVTPGDGSAPYTVTHPAVAPKFLKKAAPKPPSSPSPPHKELPGGPGAADPGTAEGPRATSYEAAGRSLTLHFTGGVCSKYAATADESGTAVKVKLVVTDPDPERVCIALAKEQSVKVTLDKPLGDRQVVDTTTGEKIARH
ncbi:hypothetical protein ACIOHE_34720 [Streptomyces sp. NPDC087851]|uniref:hypothetical protein n=1 Tax=Streptomyces sp. NPDC087851 TaxID=3365810 RepID=UPI00380660D5